MRINLPERIPLYYGIVFAIVMLTVQLLEGTGPSFALLHATFIVLSVIAFNVAGGFTSSSGFYIFWYSTLTILVGTVAKAVLGEAADSNSQNPVLGIAAFTVGMAGMLLAISLSRKLTHNVTSVAVRLGSLRLNYSDASIGCSLMAGTIFLLRFFANAGPGSITAALVQLDIFWPLAILLGTIGVAQSSGGRNAWGIVNLVPFTACFLIGVAGFSKQAMITPVVCWLIGLAYTRFRLRASHLGFIAVFAVVMVTILYPLAQVGRNAAAESASFIDRYYVAANLIENLGATQLIASEAEEATFESDIAPYFSHEVGFISRFTRWPGDSALIAFSDQGHYDGYGVIYESFLNWFPHALLPNKEQGQVGYTGNYYAHEQGFLSDEDTTTGISYSPLAEAYHIDGWISVILLAPAIWLMLFVSIDILCGDLRETPWGLFFGVVFAHIAPESLLAGVIAFVWHYNLSLFLGIVFCTNIAPVLGLFLTGASRRTRSVESAAVVDSRLAAVAQTVSRTVA